MKRGRLVLKEKSEGAVIEAARAIFRRKETW